MQLPIRPLSRRNAPAQAKPATADDAGIGYPAADLQSADTLVLVHVVCIGWLSLAICGGVFAGGAASARKR